MLDFPEVVTEENCTSFPAMMEIWNPNPAMSLFKEFGLNRSIEKKFSLDVFFELLLYRRNFFYAIPVAN